MKYKSMGLSGKRGSGKSTLSELILYKTMLRTDPRYKYSVSFDIFSWGLANYSQEGLNYSKTWTLRAFGDKVKECAIIITGHKDFYTQEGKRTFLPDFNKTAGQFLQDFAENARKENHLIWVKALFREIENEELTLFTDVRHTNEMMEIEQIGGLTIKIIGNPQGLQGDGTRDDNNLSEIALDNHQFRVVIHNDGTLEELSEKVDILLDWLEAGAIGNLKL